MRGIDYHDTASALASFLADAAELFDAGYNDSKPISGAAVTACSI